MQKPVIRSLPRTFVEKVWGVAQLPKPFMHPSDEKIGEVWFDPPSEMDQLLVKYIFASERLSIQAHPGDGQAQAMGLGRAGKSECWVILEAQPGATIAVGFRESISADEMRDAALDGSIVDLLVWHEVASGDVFYIPAGTVHAIGGGVSLIEVQQNTDITFRLFDYGRPRELHLEQAVEVAITEPYPTEFRTRVDGPHDLLVDDAHFRLHRWRAGAGERLPAPLDEPFLLIPFSGELTCYGEKVSAGMCALVSNVPANGIEGHGIALLAQPVRAERSDQAIN